MDNLSKILQRLRPGSHYVIRGEEYDGIEWYDEVQTKPTLDEVNAAAPAVAALVAIDAEEELVPFKQRGLREWFLQEAIAKGYITDATLDPANPLDVNAQPFASFPYMLQANILQERAVRALRAQI